MTMNLSEEVSGLQRDWDRYEQDMNVKKRRCFAYVSDSRGMMHVMNLSELLQRKEIYEVEKHKKGHSY
jgi:hypothetical protein